MADDDNTPTRRRSRGRPAVAPEHRRRHAVTCRLTDAERDHVNAARGGVTGGEYIRLAALAAPPRVVPEINREAWLDLARVIGNLNQLVAKLNRNKPGAGDAMRIITDVRDQVARLRFELIGADPAILDKLEDDDES